MNFYLERNNCSLQIIITKALSNFPPLTELLSLQSPVDCGKHNAIVPDTYQQTKHKTSIFFQDLAALARNNLPKTLRPAEMAVYA